eukprot:gnl/MRDRNA2_/MRDRNA2_77298_c0_seq1.p1 gnl/MRDRNA2_/MRDRNA2_77298_c0~~gnl/MRDRNA2_/MRDRNA2_77298_c0_seq1.p1  ORF type:complete len:1196 (+),score=334.06 gnl/MRDRNA2_/MRDRNA2_77298_c0_seq1:434-3589(+)
MTNAARARTLSSPPSLSNLGHGKAAAARDRRSSMGYPPMRYGKDVRRASFPEKKQENPLQKTQIQRESKRGPQRRHTTASVAESSARSFQMTDQLDWERSRSPSCSSSSSESVDSLGPTLFADDDRDELLQELQKQQLSFAEERRRSSVDQSGKAGRPAKRERLLLGLQEKARQVMQLAGRKGQEKEKKTEIAEPAVECINNGETQRPESPQRNAMKAGNGSLAAIAKDNFKCGIAAPAAEGLPDTMCTSESEFQCVVADGEAIASANPQSPSPVEQEKHRGRTFGAFIGRALIKEKGDKISQAEDGQRHMLHWRLKQNSKSERNSLVLAKEEALQRVSELEAQREHDRRLQRRQSNHFNGEQEEALRRVKAMESQLEADHGEHNLQTKTLESQLHMESSEHRKLLAWKTEALQEMAAAATRNLQKERDIEREHESWMNSKEALLEEIEEMKLQKEIQNFNEKAEQINFLAGRQEILQDVEQLEMQLEHHKTKNRSLLAAKDRGLEEVRSAHERAEVMFQEQQEHLAALEKARESERAASEECTCLLNEKVKELAEWERKQAHFFKAESKQEKAEELLRNNNVMLHQELEDSKMRYEAVQNKLALETCCRKHNQVECTRLTRENEELATWEHAQEKSEVMTSEGAKAMEAKCMQLMLENTELATWNHKLEESMAATSNENNDVAAIKTERSQLKRENEVLVTLRHEQEESKGASSKDSSNVEAIKAECSQLRRENEELTIWKQQHRESMAATPQNDNGNGAKKAECTKLIKQESVALRSEDDMESVHNVGGLITGKIEKHANPIACRTQGETECRKATESLEAKPQVSVSDQRPNLKRRLSVAEKLKQRDVFLGELQSAETSREEAHLQASEFQEQLEKERSAHQAEYKSMALLRDELEEMIHAEHESAALWKAEFQVMQDCQSETQTCDEANLLHVDSFTEDEGSRSPKRSTQVRQSVSESRSKDIHFMLNQLRKRQDRRTSDVDATNVVSSSPMTPEMACESLTKTEVRWDVANSVGKHMRSQLQKRQEQRKSIDGSTLNSADEEVSTT